MMERVAGRGSQGYVERPFIDICASCSWERRLAKSQLRMPSLL